MVIVRVPSILFPSKVTGYYRPHFAHISRIGIELEVPQQLVDIDEIHVIVVELFVVVRVSADVTVAVHRRTPLVCST